MDSNFIALHRIHVDDFFDTFYKAFEEKDTIENQLEYTNFHIQNESLRLNRYLEKLNPNLYTDDKLWVDEIKGIIRKLESIMTVILKQMTTNPIQTFKWNIEPEKMRLLYEKLLDKFIHPNTDYASFEELFSFKEITKINGRINWVKKGLNKDPNKTSVTMLIDILEIKKVISKEHIIVQNDYLKILDNLFLFENSTSKFTTSNLRKYNHKSKTYKELEQIVQSIL